MGSKKKKAEKKKDFQKRKLRVGKTAAKPDNYTDTSFTAKSISLPNQTLAKKQTPAAEDVDLTHHLSLTRHHSATTRKEVLNYIESHLPSNTSLYKQILTMTLSLITDQSNSVREAFVSLLAACADKQAGFLELHMRSIVLFVHSAMSHIKPEVRGTSTKVLNVLLTRAPRALVKGHFVGVLRSYFSLMSWTLSDDKKAVSLAVSTSDSLGGVSKKVRANHLATLQKFLTAALFEDENSADALAIDWSKCIVLHPQTPAFMMPSNPQTYAQIKLFLDELPSNPNTNTAEGSFSLSDTDSVSTEDQETRRKITHDIFLVPLQKNLANLVRDGGEIGKEASACLSLLERFEAVHSESKP